MWSVCLNSSEKRTIFTNHSFVASFSVRFPKKKMEYLKDLKNDVCGVYAQNTTVVTSLRQINVKKNSMKSQLFTYSSMIAQN